MPLIQLTAPRPFDRIRRFTSANHFIEANGERTHPRNAGDSNFGLGLVGNVSVRLFDDTSDKKEAIVATSALTELFSFAHQWALQVGRADSCTRSSSSMLAAMTGGCEIPNNQENLLVQLRSIQEAVTIHFVMKSLPSYRGAN